MSGRVIPIGVAHQIRDQRERQQQRYRAALGEALAAVAAGDLDRLGDVSRFCRLLGLDPQTVLGHPSNR